MNYDISGFFLFIQKNIECSYSKRFKKEMRIGAWRQSKKKIKKFGKVVGEVNTKEKFKF